MDKPKASIAFRKRLKQQLPLLQAEGVLDPDHAAMLTDHYRLDAIERETAVLLLTCVYVIGAVLAGIGVISFVAAHWTAMSAGFKLVLLFLAVLAVHTLGLSLWRPDRYPKLGHALVILGTLIFGAAIGLIAQIFHIRGSWSSMFGPWAVGAIIMAYAVSSAPHVVIAAVTSFLWFWGAAEQNTQPPWAYPLALAAICLPSCYLLRSGVSLFVTLLALAISTAVVSTAGPRDAAGPPLSLLVLAVAFTALGLWIGRRQASRSLQSIAVSLGIACAVVALYVCSFLDPAQELLRDYSPAGFFSGWPAAPMVIFGAAGLLLALTQLPAGRLAISTRAILVVLLVAAAGFLLAPYMLMTSQAVAAFANVALLVLAAALIWHAFHAEDRRIFWFGIVLIGAIILGRTLEYETGLLIKSAVFTATGVAVIIGGVLFERFLKAGRSTHADA